MPDLLIRGLRVETVEQLRRQAQRRGRSLQQQLKILLEQAAQQDMIEALELADRLRETLRSRYGTQQGAVADIRADRERDGS